MRLYFYRLQPCLSPLNDLFGDLKIYMNIDQVLSLGGIYRR
jgi:hypothetical protein